MILSSNPRRRRFVIFDLRYLLAQAQFAIVWLRLLRPKGLAMTLKKIVPVPVYCQFKAFFEWDGWFVVDSFFGESDVSEGVLYVAGTRVGVERLNVFIEQLVDYTNSLIYGYGLAAGDVQDFAGGVLRSCGEQIGVDDVVNVGEIAALFAVAEDGR